MRQSLGLVRVHLLVLVAFVVAQLPTRHVKHVGQEVVKLLLDALFVLLMNTWQKGGYFRVITLWYYMK